MRMDKMTNQLQAALAEAQSNAVGRDQTTIEPEHVVLALIDQSGGSVRPMLAQAKFDLNGLRADLINRIDQFMQANQPS